MTEGIAIILMGLTILAFWKRDAALFMVNVIAWLFATFYFVNETWSASNAYLKYAIAGLCLSMALVMVMKVVQLYFFDRVKPPTSSEIQVEHRKKVMDLTKRRRGEW